MITRILIAAVLLVAPGCSQSSYDYIQERRAQTQRGLDAMWVAATDEQRVEICQERANWQGGTTSYDAWFAGQDGDYRTVSEFFTLHCSGWVQ